VFSTDGEVDHALQPPADMRRQQATWVILSAAALGCGRTQNDLGGIPADKAPTEIAQTVCAKAYGCCTPMQLMGNDLAGTDEPSCEQKTKDDYTKNLAAVLASQDRFRSVYDGTKLEACLSYIRASSCQTLGTTNHLSGIPGCNQFVQPRVAPGDACTYDWECQQAQCHKEEGQIDGKCAPFNVAGESCSASRCAPELTCDSQDKVCVAPLADGAACLRSDQCKSASCNAGADPAARTCGPPMGGLCFYSSACALVAPRPMSWSVVALLVAVGFLRWRQRFTAAGGKARMLR
jgi:hypothetical protein